MLPENDQLLVKKPAKRFSLRVNKSNTFSAIPKVVKLHASCRTLYFLINFQPNIVFIWFIVIKCYEYQKWCFYILILDKWQTILKVWRRNFKKDIGIESQIRKHLSDFLFSRKLATWNWVITVVKVFLEYDRWKVTHCYN